MKEKLKIDKTETPILGISDKDSENYINQSKFSKFRQKLNIQSKLYMSFELKKKFQFQLVEMSIKTVKISDIKDSTILTILVNLIEIINEIFF